MSWRLHLQVHGIRQVKYKATQIQSLFAVMYPQWLEAYKLPTGCRKPTLLYVCLSCRKS